MRPIARWLARLARLGARLAPLPARPLPLVAEAAAEADALAPLPERVDTPMSNR
jgi:hypothetical protein